MNNYRISLADSWHQEAQVIYETWQVILIKCRACGCKVAGREQILSRQRAAKRHALLQTRWAGLSGLPQLSCKPGPRLPRGTDRFQLEGRRHTASLLPFHNNKHMTHKQAVLMQSKSHVDHVHLSHNRVLTRYKAQSCVFLSLDEGCHRGFRQLNKKTGYNHRESIDTGSKTPLLMLHPTCIFSMTVFI